MGRASRRKKDPNRNVDTQAWREANIARFAREQKAFAEAYQIATRRLEEEKAAVAKAAVARTQDLLLPVAPETAPAATASGEVPADDSP